MNDTTSQQSFALNLKSDDVSSIIPLCTNASFDMDESILAMGCPTQREVHIYHWNHSRWVPTPSIRRPTQLLFGRQVKLIPKKRAILVTSYQNIYQFKWRPDHRWNFHSVYYNMLRDFGALLSLTQPTNEILVASESHVHVLGYDAKETEFRRKNLNEYPIPIKSISKSHVYANDTLFSTNHATPVVIGDHAVFTANDLLFCYIDNAGDEINERATRTTTTTTTQTELLKCWFNHTMIVNVTLPSEFNHVKSLYLDPTDTTCIYMGYPDYFNHSTDTTLPRGRVVLWDLVNDQVKQVVTTSQSLSSSQENNNNNVRKPLPWIDDVWYFGTKIFASFFELASVVDGDYLYIRRHHDIIDTRHAPLIENIFHSMDSHFITNHSSSLHNETFTDHNQTTWSSENITIAYEYPVHLMNDIDFTNESIVNEKIATLNRVHQNIHYMPLGLQFGFMMLFLALPLILMGFTFQCCTGKGPPRRKFK